MKGSDSSDAGTLDGRMGQRLMQDKLPAFTSDGESDG